MKKAQIREEKGAKSLNLTEKKVPSSFFSLATAARSEKTC